MLPGFQQSQELTQSSDGLMHAQFETRQLNRGDVKDAVAARKIQKADREKLRRDRLNEQFSELGSVLDPDRPKNDKATILGDTIQILKELTAEVKRLKSEQCALTEESRDLTQEKNELREEKATLKAEVDQLRSQYEQRLRTIVSWPPVDPTLMMGPAPFSYPMPASATGGPDSHPVTVQSSTQTPVVATPFVPIPVHPSYPVYPFFGSRTNDGSNPYLAFPTFPSPVNTHTHIERPSAQYPSPLQRMPGYLVQPQATSANQTQSPSSPSRLSKGSPIATSREQPDKSFEDDTSHAHASNNRPLPLLNGCRSSINQGDAKCTDLELKMPGTQLTASYHRSDQSCAFGNACSQNLQAKISQLKKLLSIC
eukprot:TRINITY_DN12059_c0_g1_i4.p1 TRINITY_DN12059_c0_g1~~TRINITY_DN12059_c0_g1_i4.p1  ORF type:complete len:368 (+),score=81.46 TRINITY_DN12059_c0_g1_i4:468-1571(+)